MGRAAGRRIRRDAKVNWVTPRPTIAIFHNQTRRCGGRATGVSCRQEGSPWASFRFNCRII